MSIIFSDNLTGFNMNASCHECKEALHHRAWAYRHTVHAPLCHVLFNEDRVQLNLWSICLSTRMTVCKCVPHVIVSFCVCVCVCVCVCISVLRSLPSVRRDPESPLQSSSDEKPQTPSKHPKHPIMPITPHAWAPALRTHHRPRLHHLPLQPQTFAKGLTFFPKIVWENIHLPYNY